MLNQLLKQVLPKVIERINDRASVLTEKVNGDMDMCRIGAVHEFVDDGKDFQNIVYWHTTGSGHNPVRNGFNKLRTEVMLKPTAKAFGSLLNKKEKFAEKQLNIDVKKIYASNTFQPRKDGKTALTDKIRIMKTIGSKFYHGIPF